MHVAITGASSGIGEALAREYATPDNALSLVARRRDRLEELEKSLQCPVKVCVADLSVLDSCCDWIAEAEAAHGPIDVLVNNAGVQCVEPGIGVGDERGERLLTINLLSPIRLINRVVPKMVERERGAVVNISSMAGITATPWMAHYSSSKAAIAAFSEVMRHELRDTGVHFLTVYPGPVATPMERAARQQLQQSWIAAHTPTGRPEILASRIRACVEHGKPHLYYPSVYGVARYFRFLSQWLTTRLTPDVRVERPEAQQGGPAN